MASFDSGQPHLTLPKDVSVGGIRLLSSIMPYHLEQHEPISLLSSSPPEGKTDTTRAEDVVGLDQGGAGEGHDVKHISTTEAEIERARSDLQNRHINIKSIRNAQSLLRGQGGKTHSGKSKAKSKKGSKAKTTKKKKTKSASTKKKKSAKSKAAKKKTSKSAHKKKSGKKQSKKKKGGKR